MDAAIWGTQLWIGGADATSNAQKPVRFSAFQFLVLRSCSCTRHMAMITMPSVHQLIRTVYSCRYHDTLKIGVPNAIRVAKELVIKSLLGCSSWTR